MQAQSRDKGDRLMRPLIRRCRLLILLALVATLAVGVQPVGAASLPQFDAYGHGFVDLKAGTVSLGGVVVCENVGAMGVLSATLTQRQLGGSVSQSIVKGTLPSGVSFDRGFFCSASSSAHTGITFDAPDIRRFTPGTATLTYWMDAYLFESSENVWRLVESGGGSEEIQLVSSRLLGKSWTWYGPTPR
jgi:hypothetical protein